jgi:RNA-directed DNA polymerase
MKSKMKKMKNLSTTFNNINWKKCYKIVAKLQEKIVVAYNNGNKDLVKSLQKVLINSFAARAIAVKKVVTNDGGKTPGIDNEIWNTESKRTVAITKLLEKPYKPKPLKRVYIPKANGKRRPLSIPTIYDRAMQALYHFALDPIAECVSDIRSYGFRKYRSVLDAIEYIFILLGTEDRARYILEVDIKGFFDNISHEWLLKNIPIEKTILKKWLKSGYFENSSFFNSKSGVPQGGVISPIIANLALNGIEKAIKDSVKHFKKNNKPKVNVVRYVDDFIVTGKTEEILKEFVLPAIKNFLSARNLELNLNKTKITKIEDGFDFLGFNIRKFKDPARKQGELLVIKPSQKSIKNIKAKIKYIFDKYKKVSSYILISKLNPLLRGWANYYRTVISKRIYTKINAYVWTKLWNWARRKHLNYGLRKLKKLYFRKIGNRDWVFTGHTSEMKEVYLYDITSTKIIRHTLCKEYNHYLSEHKEYFENRTTKDLKNSNQFNDLHHKLLIKTKGLCMVCQLPIKAEEEIEIHHILSKKLGGKDTVKNLLALHKVCHHNVTYNKNPVLQAKYLELGIIQLTKK